MKMVKKVLFGALTLAAVLTFASCGETQDEENALKNENIDFTEDPTQGDFYRSFKSTKTKHYSSNAKITINDADNYKEGVTVGSGTTQSTVSSKAGFGFVFGLREVTKDEGMPTVKKTYIEDGETKTKKVKFYTFGIAAVRWNAATDKAQCYVEWARNVPDTVFNYNDSAEFYDLSLSSDPANAEITVPQCQEFMIVHTNNGWKDIPTSIVSLDENGNLAITIKTVAEDDGSYTVSLCDAEGEAYTGCTSTIPVSATGLTEGKKQLYIGRYITVYKDQTVTGKIEYTDTQGNIIPADYIEDDEE